MKHALIKLAVCILFAVCLSAHAMTSAEQSRLIEGMASGSEAGLVEARQLLPRAGVEALDRLLKLLAHEDERVWRTARNILADISNGAAAPGHRRENARVTETLLQALAATDSAQMREELMRLLPLSKSPRMDLTPVAALLNGGDEVMKEKARACLREIRTPAAAAILADALDGAAPEFQIALLNALAQLRNVKTVNAIMPFATDADPRVRNAAARALAWTGDPRHRAAIEKIVRDTTPSAKDEAWDALIRFAHALGDRGGNWQGVLALFDKVLAESDSTALRNAAISGLGQYGDETVIARIAEAVGAEGGENLEGAALQAFRYQDSRAARAALSEVYPEFSPQLRANVLLLMGDLGHADAVGQFYALEPEGSDALVREAAIAAMAATTSPEALPLMAAYLAEEAGDSRARTIALLMNLANAYEKQGLADTAGQAYLLARNSAEDAATQKAAMDGILRNPVADAAELILTELGTDSVSGFPVPALIALRNALNEQNRTGEAKRLDDVLLKRLSETATVQALINEANRTGTQEAWMERLGFIRDWHILGPFPFVKPEEGTWMTPPFDPASIDLAATYPDGAETRAWQAQETGALGGMMDLGGTVGAAPELRVFAHTTLDVPEARDAALRLGSDDGVRVWVNGGVVHENYVDRGQALDQDVVPVKLVAGENTILLEIIQHAGGCGFLLRVTDPEGVPLAVR